MTLIGIFESESIQKSNCPYLFEIEQYQTKASIGFAFIPKNSIDSEKIMDIADQRMYVAK